jgi:hypothetical protein
MENLSPSRIQPISPGGEKESDDPRPQKKGNSQAVPRNAPPPPRVDLEVEKEEQHQLDERA